MAIFGDVNDNRVIPLILMSGLIFLAGMYIVYIYRWIKKFLTGKSTTKSCKISNTNDFPPIDPYIHLDVERRQSMHWEPDSTTVIFQPSVKPICEDNIEHFDQSRWKGSRYFYVKVIQRKDCRCFENLSYLLSEGVSISVLVHLHQLSRKRDRRKQF
jgi:hypothetical protein